MKKVIFLALFFSTLSHAQDTTGATCPVAAANKVLDALNSKVNAICDWSVEQIVDEHIIKECEQGAKKDDRIYFRNEDGKKSPRFSEFSDSFNVSDKYYFCKNRKGHASYRANLVNRIKEEVRLAHNKPSAPRKPNNIGSGGNYTAPPASSAKEQQWICTIPSYIKVPRTVNEEEKKLLEMTYESTRCIPKKG